MTYFDYLSMTRKEDNQKTYIDYLMDYCDYSEADAINYSKLFYDEEGNLKGE